MHLLWHCSEFTPYLSYALAKKSGKQHLNRLKDAGVAPRHRCETNSKPIWSVWYHNVANNVFKFLLTAFHFKIDVIHAPHHSAEYYTRRARNSKYDRRTHAM